MTNDQEVAGRTVRFRAMRFILIVGLIFLASALLIGSMAWLLYKSGIGLSLDTCFLMATMISCAMMFSIVFAFLGAAIVYGISEYDLDKSQTEDPHATDHESDVEEIANLVIAKILHDESIDDFVQNKRTVKPVGRKRR